MAVTLSSLPAGTGFPGQYIPGEDPELDAQLAGLAVGTAPAAEPPMPQLVTPPRLMPGPMPIIGGQPAEPAPVEAATVPPAPTPIAPPPAQPPAPDLSAALAAVGPDVKTTTTVPTKGYRQAQAGVRQAEAALGANDESRKVTAGKETKLAQDKAQDVVQDENQFAEDRKALEARTVADRAKIDAQKTAAVSAAKELREQHARDYEKPFFEGEKGVAKSWLAALSVGLGQYSAAMRGGPNMAWDIMQSNLAAHASREKGRLQRQKEEIERLGQDATALTQQLLNYDTITRPQQEAALLQSAAERRRRLMTKYGHTEAAINGDKLLQDIEAQKQERAGRVEAGIMAAEAQLAGRREVDNSEENKARRALAAAGAGGIDKPYKDLSESERKGRATIRGAMTAVKNAQGMPEYSAKDRETVDGFVGAMRNVDPSDPTKFWAAANQIKGSYYNQLSAAGKSRLNEIWRAAQDLERNTSGAVIGANEIADFIGKTAQPGGLGHLTQRMKDMAWTTGQPTATMQEIAEFEGQGSATSSKQTAEIRAQAVTAARSTSDPSKKAALEWVLKNAGDPRAVGVLSKALSK